MRSVATLTDEEVLTLYYDWGTWARPSQMVPPGNWLGWLLMAGRGFGKTRVGAEWIRDGAENGCTRMALLGATSDDVRETMIEGESGILATAHPNFRPNYEPSKHKLSWPNGAIARCYSAEEPRRLRGPQHDRAWCDELAAWKYPRDTWDMLLMGLRIGKDPRVVITTTPKPITLLREMVKDPTIVTTGGSTYENLDNLAEPFRKRVLARYEGTTLGRQELHAELFDEMPGALWRRKSMIDAHRVRIAPDLVQVAVAVDPSVSDGKKSAEAGIVWGGRARNGHVYVCGDESMRGSPDAWARRVVEIYVEVKADRIIYESNQGGDLIPRLMGTIKSDLSIRGVHASRGKYTRAEPIAALYEQGKVHHVGIFPDLEDQQCNWIPGEDSPDRLDALVWLVTHLTPGGQGRLLGPATGTKRNRSLMAV